MSQLNSQKISLACDWQYKVEGDPFPKGGAGLDMGLTINPGYFVTGAFYNIMEPITTTGNPAIDTIRIFFWIDFFGVTLCLSDTIANINAKLLGVWYAGVHNDLASIPNSNFVQNPQAIATPGIYQIFIASTAPLTGGRIATVWDCVQLDVKY